MYAIRSYYDYSGLSVVAIKAIQELHERFEAKFEDQNARIAELEKEIEALRGNR